MGCVEIKCHIHALQGTLWEMHTLVFETPAIDPPDTALLAAWADGGDERAFAALVERYVQLVHGAALRRLGEEDAAREVTQTVFAILARKAHALKNVRVLAAWLHRVTSAQSARAIRQLVRDRRLKISAMQHASLTTGGRDPLADALPLLDEALDHLPERDRMLLMLRYSEGISFAEASVRTGRGEAALRQQTVRAVDRLASALRRKGVNVPAAALTTGLAGVFSGGPGKAAGAEIARKALLAAPAIPAGTLFLTTLLTMNTLKTAVAAGIAALLLTGIPAIRQGLTLTDLRNDTPAAPVHPANQSAASPELTASTATKAAKTKPEAASRPAAPMSMDAIGAAAEASMQQLLLEATDRMATIESRRIALALGLSPDAETALRRYVAEIYATDIRDNQKGEEGKPPENFQQRTRRLIEEHLSATAAPEQVERWRTLQRQRQETDIEKVASDAFHATARLVDLTPEQKDALFQKCSTQARELYATPWSNSAQGGAAISPQQGERLEDDTAILRDVLTPQQLTDWQALSTSQRDFQNSLPRRIVGNLFSVASGGDLAEALRSELPPVPAPPTAPATDSAPQ
jgi:RNA polymerase sigma factor (sigma-70 family)